MKKLSLPFSLVLERRGAGTSLLVAILAITVFFAPIARAGPINYLGDPAISSLQVIGGTFLPTSPPDPPPGNPPLATASDLIVLPKFGFFDGIRAFGTMDFTAVGGAATVSYIAVRPFNVGESETDNLPIFYDIAYWSNDPTTTASRVSYNAETFVPGIGLTGTGSTIPTAIPFNSGTIHPPRPLFGTTLDDTSLNILTYPAAAGDYIMFQRVQIEFDNLTAGEVIRIDANPVESSIEGAPVPEPPSLRLSLFGSILIGSWCLLRIRSQRRA
jgi:hypothetical protein